MKKLPPISLLMALLFLFTVPGLADTFSGGGVSLEAPSGWTEKPAQKGAQLILMAPDAFPKFHPNVNVMVQNTGTLTYDQYKAITEKETAQAKGTASNYQKFTFDDGTVGRSIEISFQSGGMNVRTLSAWRMVDGKTYLVTGITLADDFPNRLPAFSKIAKSLKL